VIIMFAIRRCATRSCTTLYMHPRMYSGEVVSVSGVFLFALPPLLCVRVCLALHARFKGDLWRDMYDSLTWGLQQQQRNKKCLSLQNTERIVHATMAPNIV
jgi:hypothetical protein